MNHTGVVFHDWLNAHSILFLRFIHVIVWCSVFILLWQITPPMYGYIMFCLSIHQLIDTGLLFYLLAIMNNSTMKTYVRVSVWIPVSISFDTRGNAGSNDNSAWRSEELRLFQSGYTTATSSVWVFYCPHILTNTCYFLVSVCFSNHLNVCEVVFDAAFSFDCDISLLLKTLSMLP